MQQITLKKSIKHKIDDLLKDLLPGEKCKIINGISIIQDYIEEKDRPIHLKGKEIVGIEIVVAINHD